jgi:hypothetical protein
MDSSLRLFVRQFGGFVLASLVPVIVVAFLSVPFIVGGHPGEPRTADPLVAQHMT